MKAKTDLYCSKCGAKVYSEGDEMMDIAPFRGNAEHCNDCDNELRRRTNGGQSDHWNFVESPLDCDNVKRFADFVKWLSDEHYIQYFYHEDYRKEIAGFYLKSKGWMRDAGTETT